jgi:hypothetical protein
MVLCRLVLVLEIETLTETILHAQKWKRFALGARDGYVACATAMRDRATLNALVEDSLKKSTEGHHHAFAHVRTKLLGNPIDISSHNTSSVEPSGARRVHD